MSIFRELKRRNVFRVAAAYIVTAWLIVQVVETLFPIYGLSTATVRLVVNLLAIGLVPAVVLAWVFEWTPEGLKKDEGVDHRRAASIQAAKRLDRMILVVLAVAIGYFAIDKFIFDPARDAAKLASAIDEAREEGREEAKKESRDSSIAVLAFQDLSPDGDQAYFAEGLTVDLINQLGNVPGLLVTGKTSAFSLKGKDRTIPEIGAILNVGHVLDGSVSKVGDRVRTSVALSNTRNGTQVWSQMYDKTLGDIFAIRDEITFSVYDKLAIEFERLQQKNLRTDPKVYDLTLQARYTIEQSYSTDNDQQAVELVKQTSELLAEALAIDPEYTPALLFSSLVQYHLLNWGVISDEEERRNNKDLIDRVLAIDPDNGAALGALAWNDWEGRLDIELAARRFSDALRTAPGNLELTRSAGIFARSIGHHEASIALLERCVAADPVNSGCAFQLAQSYLWGNRLEDALNTYRKLEVLTGRKGAFYYVVLTLLLQGGPVAALKELESMPGRQSHPQVLAARAMIMHDLGRYEEFSAALDSLTALFQGQFREDTYYIAQAYAWIGDKDRAFEWLEMAYTGDERYGSHGWWFNRVMFLPIWQKLHDDPRWNELRERMGFSDARLEKVEFSIPEWMSPRNQPL